MRASVLPPKKQLSCCLADNAARTCSPSAQPRWESEQCENTEVQTHRACGDDRLRLSGVHLSTFKNVWFL